MTNFLTKSKIFAEVVIAFALTYFAIYYPINFLLSLFLIAIGVFVLFDALGNIDKLNNYGPYNTNTTDSSDHNPYITQDKHNHHKSNNINVTVNTKSDTNPYTDDVINDSDFDFNPNSNPYYPYNFTEDTDEEESFINPDDFIGE